ncbi:MAG: hypothetical protein JST54_10795 [Deltaproteobacteria bacterium]|nr:hypothetical protein [Deltaproteobacteria bacterium]
MDTTPSLDQKTIRTSPILWILGILFALFLGALGTQGLSDAADLFREPSYSEISETHLQPLRDELAAVERQPDPREAQIASAERDYEDLSSATRRGEESWRAWLETRATLGGTKSEDQSVRARRDNLDAMRAERDAAQVRLATARAAPDPREKARDEIQKRIQQAEKQAQAEYDAAERVWRWKVLAARVALAFPVVVVAIVLWRRRAKISYVTLLWGYWAFALWMVLWGMGPYLPRYGGYAPLALGLGVTAWGTITLARWLNSRASIRRRRIVDQAIAKHRCPGCDRDYLLGRETSLDAGLGRKARTLHYDVDALHPRICAACGLALYAPCPSCQSPRLVHAEHCSSCGTSTPVAPVTPPLAPEPMPG